MLGRGAALTAVAACHLAAVAAIARWGWRAQPAVDTPPVIVAVLVPGPIARPAPAAPTVRPAAGERQQRPPVTVQARPPGSRSLPQPERRTPPAPRPSRNAAPAVVADAAPTPPAPAPLPVGEAEPVAEPVPQHAALRTPAEVEPAVAAAVTPATTPASFDAAYLGNPPPRYPLAARRMGEQGTVLLLVQVGENGRVSAVEVSQSSGSGRLDRAALDAVANWRFEPARRGSIAVTAAVEVPIVFRLEN